MCSFHVPEITISLGLANRSPGYRIVNLRVVECFLVLQWGWLSGAMPGEELSCSSVADMRIGVLSLFPPGIIVMINHYNKKTC
jgi:hypothetical protein